MTYISKDQTNYLAHHGVLGQKWGKKNGPPYPLDAGDHSESEKKAGWQKSIDDAYTKKKKPKKLQKELNKLDKDQSKHLYERNRAEELEKWQERLRNKDIRKHGRNSKQALKRESKIAKYAERKQIAEYKLKRSEQETWKLLAEATKSGYDVHSEKFYRDVKAGKRLAATFLAGPIAGSLLLANNGRTSVEANKYKVNYTESMGDTGNLYLDTRKLPDRW